MEDQAGPGLHGGLELGKEELKNKEGLLQDVCTWFFEWKLLLPQLSFCWKVLVANNSVQRLINIQPTIASFRLNTDC